MDPRPWIALNSVTGVGKVFYKRLINRFGSPEEVFGAPEVELMRIEGARAAAVKAIKAFDGWGKASAEADKAAKAGASIVTYADSEYPPNLKDIHDPPPYLYVRGNLMAEDKVSVAVVGSRLATTYGRQITRRIARDLAGKGVTIVSGGARGIDTEAHRGALAAKGRTIAVLGCGIDVVYPSENAELFGLIAGGGAVVTEYPMGAPPEPNNFPPRNRIISGISIGVVVIEAAGDSGSLITASYSLEQGREVYAVPGSVVSPTSRGTNSLIKRGAKLVEGSQDILIDLFPALKGYLREMEAEDSPVPSMDYNLDPEEKTLFECISCNPVHIDTLVSKSGLGAATALSLLLGMELKGAVRQLSGMRFVRGL